MGAGVPAPGSTVISSANSLALGDTTARHTSSAGRGSASALTTDTNSTTATGTTAQARAAATSQAALAAAASTHKASTAGHGLDKQQTTLAGDLRAAMHKAGVKLFGAVEFSVSSEGAVSVQGTDADKAATTKFLNADASRPSFATRIATQAKDALHLSSTIRQSAAISQAARYGGRGGGVMSLYTSLMQSSGSATAVFAVSPTTSSLTYPGSLAAKA